MPCAGEFRGFLEPFTPEQLSSAGVYAIRHALTGRVYVGSTSRSFKRRWLEHLRDLAAGIHHAPRLQHAWNKYGPSGFTFEILVLTTTDLVALETRFFAELGACDRVTGFNAAPEPKGRTYYELSPESRERLSKAHRGKVFSEKTRQLLSEALKGRKRPKEIGDAVRRALAGRKLSSIAYERSLAARRRPVRRLDTHEVYVSARAAADALGLNPTAVSNSIHRNRRSGGTFWRYVDTEERKDV